MLKDRLLKIGKGLKGFVNNKIQTCKDILSEAQNRLILGLILLGLGGGLVASAYIRIM